MPELIYLVINKIEIPQFKETNNDKTTKFPTLE